MIERQSKDKVPELKALSGGRILERVKIEDEEIEFNGGELVWELLTKVPFILLAALLGAVLLGGMAVYMHNDSYVAAATLSFSNVSDESDPNLIDFAIANTMKGDYMDLPTSPAVLEQVKEQLGLNMTISALRNMIEVVNPDGSRLIRITVEAGSRERAVEIANALAQTCLELQPRAGVQENLVITQEALVENEKTSSGMLKKAVIGFALGGGLVCAWVVFRYLYKRKVEVTDREVIESKFGFVPLSCVPNDEKLAHRDTAQSPLSAQDGKLNIDIPRLGSAAEEGMNTLRVNVRFTGREKKKLLITSSVPMEGKSTVAVQLWGMLARSGQRCVLVDGDLRGSGLKQMLRMDPGGKGLEDYLSGAAEYEDVVRQTSLEGAWLVPSLRQADDPALLLDSVRMKELLDRLAGAFDYVIVDSPALTAVSDAAVLAPICDGTILVVRARKTHRREIYESLVQLARTEGSFLGVVLNREKTIGLPIPLPGQ